MCKSWNLGFGKFMAAGLKSGQLKPENRPSPDCLAGNTYWYQLFANPVAFFVNGLPKFFTKDLDDKGQAP